MGETDKIMYALGYYSADPHKKAQIQSYIDEAVEFMKESGVSDDKLTSQRAYAVKSIWADYRDKGEYEKIIKKDGMVVSLISQLRR